METVQEIKFAHKNSSARIVNTPIVVNKGGDHLREIALLGKKAEFLLELKLPKRPETYGEKGSNLRRPYNSAYPPHMQIEVD